MEHLHDESTDLKLHAHLCSERYKGIQDQFENLENRMDKVEGKLDELKSTFQTGNKTLWVTIITTGGSIVVAIIGAAALILTR